ncbi:uncharacterized protein LOC121390126 [Gigantopelta aegis]|uniref:uncharacterized protein LOC121390126 n=1 Tax=Gigantopelta aegis TaxID=1735272 RepID=UPI001B88AF9E|nr:uncharacterized protein LOC121390126 [Gigantopelta aegis]
MDEKISKSKSVNRHYCCVCKNYRGKLVDCKNITLHRFPSNVVVRAAWLKRIKVISQNFKLNERDDRLCSAHFKGDYVKGNVPSVFILDDGRVKTFATNTVEYGDVPEVNTTSDQFELQISEDITNVTFVSELSNEYASVMLHDYCGPVYSNIDNFCQNLNKNEQTHTLSTHDCSTQTPCIPEMTSVCTQTCSIPLVDITELAKSGIMRKDMKSVGIQAVRPDLVIEDIMDSDDKCMFYTGLPNAATFKVLFSELPDAETFTHRAGSGNIPGRPRMLRLIDEFFLVLLRVRLGLLLEDISTSTCSNITIHWISYLSVKLSSLTPFPSKAIVQKTMPNKFKKKYPNCRIIIDCTEIFTENPQSLKNKSLMFSHYKSHMTYKALLGISPSGVITFASDLWAGSISDKQLTLNCGILDLCQRGDSIMADKGFLISDLTIPRGIRLIIPPLKYQRFTRRQVEETRRIANLRIDVERAMERVKNFRILQGVIPITLAHQATKIWKICVGLSNLLPPLVHDEDD